MGGAALGSVVWEHVCAHVCVQRWVTSHLAVQGLCIHFSVRVHQCLRGRWVTTGLSSEAPAEEPAVADDI